MALRFGIFVLIWTLLSLSAPVAMAAGKWEAAILFLSSADDTKEYHKDVDANILELARLIPSQTFQLTLLREFNGRAVTFHPDPTSKETNTWDSLFLETPVKGILVPGPLKIETVSSSIVTDSGRLKLFLNQAFPTVGAKRILIIQTHGFGPKGIKQASLLELQKTLSDNLPSGGVDIFWLDSCLMANLESLYQLRNIAPVIIASQDTEFSAGAPFEALNILNEGSEQVEGTATFLASRFVESYSILEEGSQRRAVFSSAATVSVIDTKTLEPLVLSLGQTNKNFGGLTPEVRAKLRKAMPKISMEAGNLVDLSALLLRVAAENKIENKLVGSPSQILEIGSLRSQKTNPRIALIPPVAPPGGGQRVVYGWENWNQGHQNDPDTLEKIPTNLAPTAFLMGPRGLNWPSRNVNKKLWVTPFSPGLNQFSFYFTDGKTKTLPQNFRRTSDYVTRNRKSENNPIIFSAYSQGIGKAAEKYNGLTVANPFMDLPSLGYLELDFFKKTGWTQKR